MADDIILTRPGGPDINKQFQANKIRRTRRIYDRIKNHNSGDYNFGELTSFFYSYDEDQDDSWQRDIADNYPSHIIEQIKQNVISVLSQVNPNPHAPDPVVSLQFVWDDTPPVGVTMTYDPLHHAYTMKINGLKAPAGTSYETRKTKSY